MPQVNIYLDLKEDEVIKYYSEKWKLSKIDTIKRIIIEFGEKE